jgi:hypothetical protein
VGKRFSGKGFWKKVVVFQATAKLKPFLTFGDCRRRFRFCGTGAVSVTQISAAGMLIAWAVSKKAWRGLHKEWSLSDF